MTHGLRPLLPGALFVLLQLSACPTEKAPSPEPAPPPETTDSLQTPMTVVRALIAAMGDEDLDRYFTFVHPDSPLVKDSREVMHLFSCYELRYDIEDIHAKLQPNGEARVWLRLITRKNGGLPYNENATEMTYVLRRHKGSYKVFSYEYGETRYLKD